MRHRKPKPLAAREAELAALDARLLGVRRAISLVATCCLAGRDPDLLIGAAFAEVEHARLELRILADAEAERVVNQPPARATK